MVVKDGKRNKEWALSDWDVQGSLGFWVCDRRVDSRSQGKKTSDAIEKLTQKAFNRRPTTLWLPS